MGAIDLSADSTWPILQQSPIVRTTLTVAVWTLAALSFAALLTYCGLLLSTVVRRAQRGYDLDRILLRLWLLRRRARPAGLLKRLERRVVWGTLAAGVFDATRRFLWLPDSLEVGVAPADLHTMGQAARQLQICILERLLALTKTSPCRFRARPVVALVEDPGCQPGQTALRLSFAEATEQTSPASDPDGSSGGRSAVPLLHYAYLHPLHPFGRSRRLQRGHPFFIGRLTSCDLVLEDPAVSRQHAMVYEHDRAWHIADLGSRSGTFVNLMPAVDPVPLSDGDEIHLGTAVSIRFELR
jgi:FHA domain